mmetsp:Transcript_14306/g.18781  ORF Transcript_14306/g.18781 Transcript_14306/m.18781 type:complete len:424 (+) Transcript_14306:148-1419(+)
MKVSIVILLSLAQYCLVSAAKNTFNSEAHDLVNLRGATPRWRRTQTEGYVSVVFPAEIDSVFESAFEDAAAFWNNLIAESTVERIVIRNAINVAQFGCTDFTFQAGDVIEGLVIIARIEAIDGAGGTLGAASPCIGDPSLDGTRQMPRVGFMRFDEVDVNRQSLATTQAVIEHEMGHVLGIGSLWNRWGNQFVSNPCTSVNPCNTNPTYIGPNGIQGFNDLGGSGTLPVANQGGFGTVNAHWRESVFQGELMTGFLSGGTEASIMTLRSMIDLGYDIKLEGAEAFQIPGVPLPDDADIPEEWEDIDDVGDNPNLGDINNNNGDSSGNAAGVVLGVGAVLLLSAVAVVAFRRNRRSSSEQRPNLGLRGDAAFASNVTNFQHPPPATNNVGQYYQQQPTYYQPPRQYQQPRYPQVQTNYQNSRFY